MPNISTRSLVRFTAAVGLAAASAPAQTDTDLARFFGFEEPRIVVTDQNPGPALTVDLNEDGLMDFLTVNNSKSRIEVHLQRQTPLSDVEIERQYRVNRLPPSRWYERKEISVAHRVSAFRTYDFDRDGRLDIIYAGQPGEIVLLRRLSGTDFEVASKRREEALAAGQDGFEIADVSGDAHPELLAIVAGRIHIYDLGTAGVEGEPKKLGSGDSLVAFFVEDYNGDGLNDILGIVPEDDAPLRLWTQQDVGGTLGKQGLIGPELRFEMPSLWEAEPIRFPDRAAASIGVIERASRRIVLYDLSHETISSIGEGRTAEREAPVEVHSFLGDAGEERSIAVGDLDADGEQDLLVTDRSANSIALYRQQRGVGLGGGKRFSAFKEPKTVSIGQWDDDPELEVFVLSEEEKTAGVSNFDPRTGRIEFPTPLPLSGGWEPVAMTHITTTDGPAVAIVVRDRRDHMLEVHTPRAEDPRRIELKDVNRPPQSMLAGDFDHDGLLDLALFTPNEPMVMVRSVDGARGEEQVLVDKNMPQFGLVQKAGPDNTALLDVDSDGAMELLIADENFVRACEFSTEFGWRVVEQITMPDAKAALIGVAVINRMPGIDGPVIAAADRAGRQLAFMAKNSSGAWDVIDRLRLTGIDVGPIVAGAFAGDQQPTVMIRSGGSFALVRLGGERASLEEFAAYRSDEEDRLEHEMEVGDVNGDGYVDLVVLDAREQMCQIFTLSASRRLYLATEFQVFESRLFRSGDVRDFQPRYAYLADLTGDGREDLMLEVHDRYMIYPQMTQSE